MPSFCPVWRHVSLKEFLLVVHVFILCFSSLSNFGKTLFAITVLNNSYEACLVSSNRKDAQCLCSSLCPTARIYEEA